MKPGNFTIAVIFILFFAYIFAVYDTDFRGPDEPIYLAYTASIIEDGDLNAVNQAYAYSGTDQFNIDVSKTYNLPDCHSYGGVLLWAPFYAYAKAAYGIAEKLNLGSLAVYGPDRIVRCSMSFSTVLSAFLLVLFTYLLSRHFFPNGIALWSTMMVFFGTPFFYYALFETGNNNVIAALFSTISIWFCSYATSMKKRHWFLYGLFFSVSVVVRSDLWFSIFFVAAFFIVLSILRQIDWRSGAYFFAGLIPVFILRVINSYIQYGTLYLEEMSYFNSMLYHRSGYGFNGLFSSFRGIFYTSPVLYICLSGAILAAVNMPRNIKVADKEKKTRGIFLFILSVYLLARLSLVGTIFSPGGDALSARLMFAEFPIFTLLSAAVLWAVKKQIRYLLGAASLLFILWNMLVISEYTAGLDWLYIVGAPSLIERSNALKYIFYRLFHIGDLDMKIKLFLPILLVVCGMIVVLLRSVKPGGRQPRHSGAALKSFSLFVAYLCIAYAALTLFNIANNGANVEKLKKDGFFANFKTVVFSPFGAAQSVDDDRLWLLFKLNWYYALRGDFDAMDRIIKSGEGDFNEKARTRIGYLPFDTYGKLRDRYMAEGRYTEAIGCYRKIIQLYPGNIEAYISLADIYNVMGYYPQAIDILEKAFRVNPHSINVCFRLADTCRVINDYDKAVKYYQHAVRLNPSRADSYLRLGSIYFEKNECDKAIEYYQKAVQLNSASAVSFDAYFRLGDIYSQMNEYDKAADYFSMARQLRPWDANAWSRSGDIYKSKGDYLKAIECFDKAIQLNPRVINAYINLGDIYESLSEYPRAIECYRQVIDINPNSVDSYIKIGDVSAKVGKYDEALGYFKKALRFIPDSVDIYYRLGQVYSMKGDRAGVLRQAAKLKALKKGNLAEELEKTIK